MYLPRLKQAAQTCSYLADQVHQLHHHAANNHGGWIGKDFESCPLQAVDSPISWNAGEVPQPESTVNRNLFCPFLPGAIWWLNSYHCA
jgi:hypothetical protein